MPGSFEGRANVFMRLQWDPEPGFFGSNDPDVMLLPNYDDLLPEIEAIRSSELLDGMPVHFPL